MTSLETLEGIWQARPGGLAFAVFAEGLDRAGRSDEALAIVAEGVRRWPRHLGGRLVQGRIALDKGDIETARAVFQAAADLDGSCRAALQGLAEACTRGQYFKQAFEAWSRLAALEPDNPKTQAEMRAAAKRLDAPLGIDAVAMVREDEDDRSREALSEGTTSHGSATGQTNASAFRLDLADIPVSSAFGLPQLDGPTIPELPGFQIPSTPAGSSQTLLGKAGESSFATLEMPAFPAQTIPPPPLEPLPILETPQAPAYVEPPPPPRFPLPDEEVEAEATRFFAAQHSLPVERSPVTGDDIEDRLDEVFGSSSHLPVSLPPLTTIESKADITDAQVSGRDVENRLDEIFGESSHPTPTVEMQAPPAFVDRDPEPATVEEVPVVPGGFMISGDDIEGRLDDLFGESVIDLTSPMSEGVGTGEDTSAMRKEEILPASLLHMGTDTAAIPRPPFVQSQPELGARSAESTAEMNARDLSVGATQFLDQAIKGSEIDPGGSTIDLPAIEAIHSTEPGRLTRLTSDDVDSRLDELFASSEFLAEPPQTSGRGGFVPRETTSPNVASVTGDDIEGRLDDLFGGDSDFPVGLPTVTFAEEYLRQGHRDKAASIYRQLLEKDPGNAELRRRLSEIEGRT